MKKTAAKSWQQFKMKPMDKPDFCLLSLFTASLDCCVPIYEWGGIWPCHFFDWPTPPMPYIENPYSQILQRTATDYHSAESTIKVAVWKCICKNAAADSAINCMLVLLEANDCCCCIKWGPLYTLKCQSLHTRSGI